MVKRASHQCGLGSNSNPEIGVKYGPKSFLLACPCSNSFSSGLLRFPSSTKSKISNLEFDLEIVDGNPLCGYATANCRLLNSGSSSSSSQ